MSAEDEPIQDDLAQNAAALIQDANETYRERQREQAEFLETVAEEEGEEILETTCNIIGDYTVPLKAKMNGELIDRMTHVQETGKQIEENPEAEGHKMSRVAEEMCQILDDVINDPDYNKEMFYKAYRAEGFKAIMAMLERAFGSLQDERERREGVADGFRQE
jgi:hypothetical protein